MVSENIIKFRIKEEGKQAVIDDIVNSFLNKKMIIHNDDLDSQKMDELIHFDGLVPPILDLIQDYNYLKSKGLFDEVQEKGYEYREHMKKLEDPEDRLQYSVTFLAEWIVENPHYSYIIDYMESDEELVFDDTGNQIHKPKIPDFKNL